MSPGDTRLLERVEDEAQLLAEWVAEKRRQFLDSFGELLGLTGSEAEPDDC